MCKKCIVSLIVAVNVVCYASIVSAQDSSSSSRITLDNINKWLENNLPPSAVINLISEENVDLSGVDPNAIQQIKDQTLRNVLEGYRIIQNAKAQNGIPSSPKLQQQQLKPIPNDGNGSVNIIDKIKSELINNSADMDKIPVRNYYTPQILQEIKETYRKFKSTIDDVKLNSNNSVKGLINSSTYPQDNYAIGILSNSSLNSSAISYSSGIDIEKINEYALVALSNLEFDTIESIPASKFQAIVKKALQGCDACNKVDKIAGTSIPENERTNFEAIEKFLAHLDFLFSKYQKIQAEKNFESAASYLEKERSESFGEAFDLKLKKDKKSPPTGFFAKNLDEEKDNFENKSEQEEAEKQANTKSSQFQFQGGTNLVSVGDADDVVPDLSLQAYFQNILSKPNEIKNHHLDVILDFSFFGAPTSMMPASMDGMGGMDGMEELDIGSTEGVSFGSTFFLAYDADKHFPINAKPFGLEGDYLLQIGPIIKPRIFLETEDNPVLSDIATTYYGGVRFAFKPYTTNQQLQVGPDFVLDFTAGSDELIDSNGLRYELSTELALIRNKQSRLFLKGGFNFGDSASDAGDHFTLGLFYEVSDNVLKNFFNFPDES